LARLAQRYESIIAEHSQRGPAGCRVLEAHWGHILAVQTACGAAELWEDVRRLTWAADDCLGLQRRWMERVALLQTGLAAARAEGRRNVEGALLGNLGTAHAALVQTRRAIEYFEQALAIARQIDDRQGEAAHLANLGLALEKEGRRDEARQRWAEALRICEEIESPYAEKVRGWLARSGNG
jgi:tetratricopeptide (TPR) repeat protein